MKKVSFLAPANHPQISRANRRAIALGFLSLACSLSAYGASPQWFRDVARTPVPVYESGTEGVVLLHEQITTVSDSGEVKTVYHVAKKILTAHGRDLGVVTIHFDNETRVSNVHAWSIPVQGNEYELKDKDAMETSMFSEDLYSDNRTKLLRLPAEPGSIIGYEYEQKERPEILRDVWSYQDHVPVLTARYTLVLPPSWEFETYWVNRAKAEPARAGNALTWEVANIAAVKEEDSMPAWRAVEPRMELAFFPSGPSRTERAHTSWEDIGSWYYRLANSRRQPTPVIQTSAAQLTASKTAFLDKLRVVASFAQKDVRYVAIEIGIGGYQPHEATSIFRNRYGDCKDKATVMSSMLQAVGIKSHYLLVNTQRGSISPETPSMAFNHMIIAVEVPKTEKLPASFQSIITHSKLGALLIFDPTDEVTPLGQLPPQLQANHGLLVQDKGSDLVPLPTPAPEANGLTRTAKMSLSPDGSLSGLVREVRTGSHARSKRGQLRSMPVGERRKAFENALAPFLATFSLKDFSIENLDDVDKDLVVTYSFDAPGYSKRMGPLVLVRPRVFGSKAESIDFNKKERKYPFELDAVSTQVDEFEIALPPGLAVDELPPPTQLKDGLLQYTSQTSSTGQVLTYKRKYTVGDVLFPNTKLTDLRAFYSKIQQDERSAAVLKRP